MGEPLDADLGAALARLVMRSPVLVALDFDGVLSPIVEHPDDARPTPAGAAALARLATAPAIRLALVSGRRLADLAAVATPPSGTILVGSHGAEQGSIEPDGDIRTEPLELTDEQARTLREVAETVTAMAEPAGGWVEHKPAAVVVHTRRLPDPAAAELEQAVLDAIADRAGLRVLHGKRVVEISVLHATKGEAVRSLRETTGAVGVLYAGDDVTDEDALATLDADDVGIKVGPGATHAGHRVADPEAMAAVLAELATLAEAARR
jgi:trehalose 6-phosphate phosphatase